MTQAEVLELLKIVEQAYERHAEKLHRIQHEETAIRMEGLADGVNTAVRILTDENFRKEMFDTYVSEKITLPWTDEDENTGL